MKIVLYTDQKIYKFDLPNQVFGNFCFDIEDNLEFKLINIEAIENTWHIMSTSRVNVIYNGSRVFNAALNINEFYILERDNKRYLLYALKDFDDSFKYFKYSNNIKLIVGNSKGCNVNYNIPLVKDKLFTITFKNDSLVMESNKNSYIYLNEMLLSNKDNNYYLHPSDKIEVFGFRMVVLSGIILINSPKESVFIDNLTTNLTLLELNFNNNFNDYEARDVNLYKDSDYFSKSPRIRRIIETKEIKIDNPPKIGENDEIPLIYTLGPMVTMGMTSVVSLTSILFDIDSGKKTLSESWQPLITSSAMILTTLFWPYLTKMYNKRNNKRKIRRNIKKYQKYLTIKKKEMEDESKLQRDILVENLITADACLNIINSKNNELWGRRLDQKDFLTVRIGTGDVPLDIQIKYPEENFSVDIYDTTIKEEVKKIVDSAKMIKSVPLGYSFLEKRITAIMGPEVKTYNFVKNIILQFVTFHSYEDLKLVLLTNEENKGKWSFVKFLLHNFSNDKSIRFFSTNNNDTKDISLYLMDELNKRGYNDKKEEKNFDYTKVKPYYLIITDNYVEIRNNPVIKKISELDINYGFSMICIENRLTKLPSKCDNFIALGEKTSSILENAYEKPINYNFNDEVNNNIDMNLVTEKLANIPIEFESSNRYLPDMVTFLEMENVGKIEALNIMNRWKENDPIKSLKAEIGVDDTGELMYLDIHEKAHGPHGLIAGMTGSGKSEFIITYVLSMALNYSPDYISFILIDYKGGGLAGAFENKVTGVKLPHLAGTITNLDKAEMDRTLVSINSEVRRRQAIFNSARDSLGESTIDIYKYQKFYRDGKLTEPVPHLLIICDEFAELKSQQPEFMDDLISIARIGRSLGVHLILATQKPSGVVNDQIWSNSKFRVCLKVQDKSDSMEMLKRPEAAEIKQVGRFYLQVGYDELFLLGQSAWCGAKYYPSDKIKKNINTSVDFISNTGSIIKSSMYESNTKNESKGEELANILNYIIEASKITKLESSKLWLDNIPDILLVDNLITKYNVKFYKNKIDAIIGEYDDPSNQKQNILKVNINTNGNMIIYGTQGSDREMILNSIIYSTTTRHLVEEINYYIIDYGSEFLRNFMSFPHIGDMVFLGEDEKLNNLLKMIYKEINERKKLFASFGGEYNNYIKNSKKDIPLIGIIINNYDSFFEVNPNLDDEMIQLTRDGLRYGIFFILTASSDSSLRRKLKQNFNTFLALRLNDPDDYDFIGARVKHLPKNVPGRGLFNPDSLYEFQTASIIPNGDLTTYLNNVSINLNNINDTKALKVPTLPKVVTLDYVSSYLKDLTCVPLGVSKKHLEIVTYDFTSYLNTFILSNESKNTILFSSSLILELTNISNLQLIVIDGNNELEGIKGLINYYYNSEFEKVIDMLTDFVSKITPSSNRIVFYFQNFNKFKLKIDTKKLEDFLKNIKKLENVNTIIADDYKKLKKFEYESWYRDLNNNTDGIWIGTGLSDQTLFRLSKFGKEMEAQYKNNFGFMVKDGRAELMKLIDVSGDENE